MGFSRLKKKCLSVWMCFALYVQCYLFILKQVIVLCLEVHRIWAVHKWNIYNLSNITKTSYVGQNKHTNQLRCYFATANKVFQLWAYSFKIQVILHQHFCLDKAKKQTNPKFYVTVCKRSFVWRVIIIHVDLQRLYMPECHLRYSILNCNEKEDK